MDLHFSVRLETRVTEIPLLAMLHKICLILFAIGICGRYQQKKNSI